MTTPTPVVDYTSRDYASLRADLLALIPQFLPEWTSRSDNDFGVVLLDLFSYVGDGLHYYMDRVANEAYIDTASRRSSILKIAELLNYTPIGNTAAAVTVTFQNSAGSSYVVPAGTLLSTAPTASAAGLPFETDAAVTVPAGGSANVTAHQGQTISDEDLGTSDGTADQTISLFNTPVIDGTIQVTVTQGATARLWTQVKDLVESGPEDEVFEVSTDARGIVSIRFGDDANGRVPNAGASISATYRIGGGTVGNVPANTITVIQDGTIPGTISVNNTAVALGGADTESTADIRRNAPASILGMRRATALNDYALLAVAYPGVARAHAVQDTMGSVLVYIAPTGGGGLDGTSTPTVAFAALETAVQNYLQKAAPANVTVTVLAPAYTALDISVDVYVLPNYVQDNVLSDCKTALNNLLSFDNVIFGDLITPTDVHLTLGTVPGVSYINITKLALGGGSGVAAVSLAADEIPTAGTLLFSMSGGIT